MKRGLNQRALQQEEQMTVVTTAEALQEAVGASPTLGSRHT